MADAPSPQPAPQPASRPGPGSWPVILILIGLLLLLSNLGWFNLTWLLGLLNFWPVILVAVGVNLLTRGRYALPITLGAIAVAVVLWLVGGAPGQTISVRHELEGATAARVTMALGVGQVRIDGAAPSGALATGTIETGTGERLEESYRRDGGTALLELRWAQTGAVSLGIGERRSWELSLTREVPVALHVNAGVGENRLDLREVQLSDLGFRGGVGSSRLQLPAGHYVGSIEVGVGATTVQLPAAAAARVTLTTGLGRATVQGDWLRDGDVYTTPGFESAAQRIELRVSGGVGAVTVERR